MEEQVTFKEILDYINSGVETAKANCSIGLFVSDYYEETVKEIDNFIVKKPVVAISSFVEQNELYYNVSFRFKSYNDADYKQMWKFVCKFATKAKSESERLIAGESLEKVSVLSVSIVPEKYNGKYFAYINMPLYETLSCTEDAFSGTAEISFICEEKSFGLMYADDDVIDRRSVEQEAEQELAAELGTE